jgi:flagellar basal-body rod protein FlgC
MSGVFDSLNIAGSGLITHRKWLDAVSDNIANINDATSTDKPAFQ